MLSPLEAEAAIASRVPAAPVEHVPLAALYGRVLRQPIHAERDQPPFDRVAMDGIAVVSAAVAGGRREFRVAGTQAAGAPQTPLTDPSTCMEVMTGAVLPAGSDAVVPVERLRRAGDRAHIEADVEVAPWTNVHRRGTDGSAGDLLLEPGTLLRAPEIAIVASAGLAEVATSTPPRIMVISTGDELIEPGKPIEDWQIRRSNAFAVVATLRSRGLPHVDSDHLPDDLPQLRTRLSAHLEAYDVLVLSGGVSMGRFDFIPQVLAELGVETVFHKVAQRPGKPMWFGVRPPGKTVYALPGNPVSTLVSCVRYVVPGLYASMGRAPEAPVRVALARAVEVPAGVAIFLPVKLSSDAEGRPVAEPRPTQGSGDFFSLKGSDGFIELPAGPGVAAAGSSAAFYPW